MSEAAIARLREAFTLFEAGDIEAWRETVDPEIEWDISAHPLPDWPDRGRGRDALVANLATYAAGWIDYGAEIAEIVEVGDEYLMAIHEHARLRGSDVPLERVLHLVWTVPDRNATRLRAFPSRDAALEAMAAASG